MNGPSGDAGTAVLPIAPVCIPFRELLTEPLTVSQLAIIFGFDRKTMGVLLREMEGARMLGGRWRLPLVDMPPGYLISKRILPAVDVGRKSP